MAESGKTIIFFDGVCILCNWFIKYVYKRDKASIFHFSPLQGKVAMDNLSDFGLEPKKLESLVLLHDNKAYTQAEGAYKIVKLLPFGIHKLLLIGQVLPIAISNKIYKGIAAIRYRLFGKKEECSLPSGNIKERYI